MKKLLFCAAALLAFCGCDDDDKKVEPQPKPDEIVIAPESETFGSAGGSAKVIVTSSGEWTLTGDYDWVTPSATKGKDGDIVKFTVAANETDQDKTAEYTFTVGKKTAKFTVICKKAGTVVDKISVSPESESFSKKGGKSEVIVSSSAEWTLTGEYDWVKPSVTTGKDGDVVTFQIDENTAPDPREATFTFTVGKETAEFKVSQEGGVTLTLVSDKDVTVGYQGGDGVLEVRLNTEINYRDLTQTVSAEGAEWLTYTVTLAGEGDCTARMFFSLAENTAFEPRSAKITIAGGNLSVEVNVTQRPTPVLETENKLFLLPLEGGEVNVPITTNQEYTVQIEEAAQSWITHKGKSGDIEQFTVAAQTDGSKRTGKISFVSEDITLEISVVQKPEAIINFAPSFANNCAWPLWDDPTPVTDMTAFTLEALVNPTEARRANSLSTIMGIEGKFLVRMGDVGVPWNQIQVVWDSGQSGYYGPIEGKLSNVQMTLPNTNTWYHVAVTYGNGEIKCYIDGKEVGTTTQNVPAKVNFGVEHNDEKGTTITRCFWVGYSYESTRDFKGMMSELRIWNKVLSPDELNAPNHFYTVDAASEGLVTYWKLDEGSGNKFKDYTSYGNNLSTKADVVWNEVSLPE